jgi:DNA-directed RNA polymerase specialized sigma24 family protein
VVRPVVRGLAPGAGDEQDVAQSAFRAFFDAAANNEAVQLESRDELWRLLMTISRRKATDRVRHELRARRGGKARRRSEGLENVSATTASPAEITELQDLLDHLMLSLESAADDKLKTVAVMRLEGLSTQEIAEQLNCTVRTIQRKLHILEWLWTSDE